MMRLLLKMSVLGVVLLMSFGLNAHQQKEAYTTMLFNQRTGNLEVTHRFYIHDAEHAMAAIANRKADLTADVKALHEFSDYVRDSFKVKLSEDEFLYLDTVGQEVEGKYLWVYQETPIDPELKIFKLNMTALQSVWPEQINHINVERNGKVKSVRLKKSSQWQTISLD